MTLKKSELYTKTGDSGTTSLVVSVRVRISLMIRIDIYGDLDEFNSLLGVYIVQKQMSLLEIREVLTMVQKNLFVMVFYALRRENREKNQTSPLDAEVG